MGATGLMPGPGVAAYDAYRTRRFFASLDGLRAASILAVIWHHAGVPLSQGPGPFGLGWRGVDLFFAISGFLITTLLLREREAHGTISLRAFYARRALRIFPLYYAVLLLYVALVALTAADTPEGRQFFRNLPAFASYTSNWFVQLDGRVIFYFAWSLAAEEQFYLVWPWVERVTGGGMRAVLLMVTLLGAQLAALGGLLNAVLAADSFGFRAIAGVATPIGCGVLAAHLLHGRRGFARAYRVLGARWSAPIAAGLAVGTAWLVGDGWHALVGGGWRAAGDAVGGRAPAWLEAAAVGVAMATLVAACAIREDHGLARVLAWRPAAAIGRVSYGMYLLHMLCFNAVLRVLGVARGAAPVPSFLLTVVAAFAAASLSYRWFEAPFLRWKARWSRQDAPLSEQARVRAA